MQKTEYGATGHSQVGVILTNKKYALIASHTTKHVMVLYKKSFYQIVIHDFKP